MSHKRTATGEYVGSELELFARAQNWKSYWSSKIKPLLGNSILEVGAGVGSNLLLLRENHQQWTALEPDQTQSDTIAALLNEENPASSISVINGTLLDIDPEQVFDSIIYIDVLEHIENDVLEIKHAYKHLSKGGRIIVLAPAHQVLFSPFDNSVGHYRRYNKKTLSNLRPSKAVLETVFYLDSVGCIASWCNSKILKSGMPSKSQIWFWDRLMVPLSRVFDLITAYQLGKTIIAVFKKPGNI